MTHRFKVGDRIFFEEEVLTVQGLTEINGHPAYWTNEVPFKVSDNKCSIPPVIHPAPHVMEVEARFLKVGDVCLGSGAVITHSPYTDSKCPSGKIHLGVKYPKQDQGYRKTWGKYTKIKVERA
jgi:hypothetical protein